MIDYLDWLYFHFIISCLKVLLTLLKAGSLDTFEDFVPSFVLFELRLRLKWTLALFFFGYLFVIYVI